MARGGRARVIAGAAITLGAAIVFTATAVRAFWYDPSPQIAPEGVSKTLVTSEAYPMHITIPAAQVDADVEQVGLMASSTLATPAHFTNAGWYKYGPIPGDPGTAVIVGHLDNGLGLDGAFRHLGDLAPGDEIDVTTASSTVLHFTVDGVRSYPYNAVPTDVLFGTAKGTKGSDTKAHLNLVTCAGKWLYDPTEGMTYTQRLVVSATES